jgi:hypothetical protein
MTTRCAATGYPSTIKAYVSWLARPERESVLGAATVFWAVGIVFDIGSRVRREPETFSSPALTKSASHLR